MHLCSIFFLIHLMTLGFELNNINNLVRFYSILNFKFLESGFMGFCNDIQNFNNKEYLKFSLIWT